MNGTPPVSYTPGAILIKSISPLDCDVKSAFLSSSAFDTLNSSAKLKAEFTSRRRTVRKKY